MKKIITLVLVTLSFSVFSQTDSLKTKTSFYTAVGLSIGHVDVNDENSNNFNKASYPSLELGMSRNNWSLGAIIGCENLFVSSSSRGFYELKTSISRPWGDYAGYTLFGIGAYMENGFNNFIEYGAGFSYCPKKIGYFVQYSNWARTSYVSTGLTVNF